MPALLLALAFAAVPPIQDHPHQAEELGKVHFQTTCSPAAQPIFELGVAWLHSFEYERAESAFNEAAAADSSCAIAHWGAAMSNYHPLWAPPSPADLEKGKLAAAKAEATGAKSQRERDYISAISTFYRDSDKLDHKVRSLAYNSAMADLHERYSADNEAAVFYALSQIAIGTIENDPNLGRQKNAAGILNRVLAEEPDHPGVAHYLIHSFDYPQLAELALPAARRYAEIAPASAHAQHMPSHIFTRLGLWDEAINSNTAAETAARAFAKSKNMPGSWDERLHAMDYLAYAYLQTGQDTAADRVLDELNRIERVDPPNFKVAYTVTAVPARLLLERRKWGEAAALVLPARLRALAPLDKMKWAEAHVHFARAVGAARSGNASLAGDETQKLKDIELTFRPAPGEYDWGKQVSIERRIAEAWKAYADGKKEDALAVMRAAADLDDATEKHPVTPGNILPAREQLGEMLLEAGHPADALIEYEASLRRAPRRLAGLYGAAHSAKLGGDAAKADRYYAALVNVTRAGDGTRAEIMEAKEAVKLASQ